MKKININDIFGSYKIISRNTEKKASATYWNCECIYCHNQKIIRGDSIRKNPICKCQKEDPLINTLSNDFIILEKTEQRAKDKCIIYKCKCINCNNIEYIASNVLRSKRKFCSICHQKKSTLIDLTGEDFGYLHVIKRDLSRGIGHEQDAYWICKCLNCGAIKSIRGFSLRNGMSKSCGCIKSYGEEKIAQILEKNNIYFQREYIFKDLIYQNPLRFDFAIFNDDKTLSHLVEFDGIQHYEYRNTGWNNLENFKKNQIRDQIKNQYCIDNNIKLIRIKYDEEITLERIMGWS